MKFTLSHVLKSAAFLALAASFAVHAEEVTLTAVTGLPATIGSMKHFASFRDKVNAAGKGVVQIRFLGGPEVTPGDKQADALRRGVFDIVYGPPAYYKGSVPEVNALEANVMSPKEARDSGLLNAVADAYRKKLNAHLLAMPNAGVGFNLFLIDQPKLKPDGTLDLTGVSVRTVPTYRPLVTALGGAAVNVPPADICGAMEKRVVSAVAWPGFDYVSQPWFKFVKYRVDPQFLHVVNIMLINDKKWDSLSPAAQKVLAQAAVEHENETYKLMGQWSAEEAKLAESKGIKTFAMPAEGAKAYRAIASKGLWDELEQLAPGAVRPLRELAKN